MSAQVVIQVLHDSPQPIRKKIMAALLPTATSFVCSEYGHLVLEKAIISLPPHLVHIMPIIEAHIEEIAICTHGTRLLQRCFRLLSPEQTAKAMNRLVEMSAKLAYDPSGSATPADTS